MSQFRYFYPGFSPYPENKLRSDTADLRSEGMNAPDRFELFTLEEGEKKCSEDIDTRTPNTSIFTINKEDHTIANLVRAALLKDKRVLFAAYKVTHPLFAKLILRVQTNGEITPKEAVIISSSKVVQNLGQLAQEFTKEYQLRKMVNNGGNDN